MSRTKYGRRLNAAITLLALLTVHGVASGGGTRLDAGTEVHSRTGSAAVHVATDGKQQNRSEQVRIPLGLPAQGIVLVVAGAIHQDANSNGLLDAGELIDYDYSVINVGQLALSGLNVADDSGAVACPMATLAVAANMTCTRAYIVTGADQTAAAVGNSVMVSGVDSNTDPVQGVDTVLIRNLSGSADLRGFKSPDVTNDLDASGTLTVGDELTYTFVIKNSGEEVLSSVTLSEPDPTRIDSPISCDPVTLQGQTFAGNGAGSLQSFDVVLCRATYAVRQSDADLGEVLNLAEIDGIAPIEGPIVATAASTVVVPQAPGADLGILKVGPPITPRGVDITFDIRVENRGPGTAINAVLTDPTPPGLIFVSTGGACTGPFPCALGNLAVGEFRLLTATYTVPADYAGPNPFVNTVTVTSDSIDPTPEDSSSSSSVLVPNRLPLPVNPILVPVNAHWALALLAALMLLVGGIGLRREH